MESPTIGQNLLPKELEVYQFEHSFFKKYWIKDMNQIQIFLQENKKLWVNINDIHDPQTMGQIQDIFQIHPLIMEDIIHHSQRPKLEVLDNYVFLTSKMIYAKSGSISEIKSEQISILFGKNYILTFQETPEDVFDTIRTRLENPNGKMRKMGPDYFSYTLIDAIIDQYYLILEIILENIEQLEDKMVGNQQNINLAEVYSQRKNLDFIRRNIWPIREILSNWKRSEHPLFGKKSLMYVNDAYDHSIEILESLEIQRESINSLIELYMTHLTIRQNEVMKTLTIIATIFIPLTFLTGVYGMNFHIMPELEWKYGYFVIWLVFIGITAAFALYFRHKKWV